MILYHVISSYQLLNAMVHKASVHENDKCAIIISTWLVDKFPNYDELNNFFDKVIVMDARVNPSNDYHEKNKRYCEELLQKENLCINDFSEIHVMGYHYSFGAYLSHNNIRHNFWEDAAGLLSKPEVLINLNRNGFPAFAEFCEKEKLYDGTADGIEKRYCNYSAQREGFDFSNTVDFDVIGMFGNLSKEKQSKIRAFFCNIEALDVAEKSILVLTQQLFSLRVLSFEEQILIYQLFIDYFFENENIVFKPHPDDYLYYGLLFPGSKVIRQKFPSELLPSLFKNKPKTIATISSTAISSLKNHFENSFSLGTRYEKEFKHTHKYKFAFEFKNSYLKDASVEMIGANENIKSAFCNESPSDSAKKFYVIDNVELQNDYSYEDVIDLLSKSTDNDVFVFINSKSDYCFYDIEHKEIWHNLVPLVIKKQRLRENDCYENENDELLFLFSKNQDVLNLWRGYKYEKELHHTGIRVYSEPTSMPSENILKLKTLLKATECRLLDFETLEKQASNDSLGKINEDSISEIRYSDKNISIEQLDDHQKSMRILEGIIKSTERRLIFYTNHN